MRAVAGAGLTVEGWLRPATRRLSERAKSILVLEFMIPLGSCVHMTPLYEALKKGIPGVSITVATRGLGLQVLRHSPFVDRLIETPDPLKDLLGAATSLSRQLAAQGIKPDCCLTGVPDQRTRVSLLAVLAGRGWRGGFVLQPQLYHRPLVFDKSKSQIVNNLEITKFFGFSSEPLEPKVFYTAEEAAAARALLEPLGVGGRPILTVVTRNSGGQRTGWHEERWVAVLEHACRNLGYMPVYVGTAGDSAEIDTLKDRSGVGASIAGKTTVPELAALLALSDMVLSLDTGTMHVGRASGVPMVVLGPSWQKPNEWLPLGKPHVRILRGEDRVGVPEGYRLDEIEVPAVVAALEELTRLFPPSAEQREKRLANGLSTTDHLADAPPRARK